MADEYNTKSHEYESKVGDYGHHEEGSGAPDETKDRGLFNFLGKKEEEKPAQHQEEVIVTEFDEKLKVSDYDHHQTPHDPHHESSYKAEEEEEKKPAGGLLQKLHRSGSSSSSSSDEEEGEGEERKKKKKDKKGLKDKIKEKIPGDDREKVGYGADDTAVPVEKYSEEPIVHSNEVKEEKFYEEPIVHSQEEKEEKKGFLEKIKDKLPGQHKKTEDVVHHELPAPSPPPASYDHDHHAEAAHEGGEPKEKKGILEKIKEKLPGYHPKADHEDKEIKEKEKETPSY